MIYFKWSYRYVPEGQLEPDKFQRWAIDCYVYVHRDSLTRYNDSLLSQEYLPVRVATMKQKDCYPEGVPSLVHRFCVSFPTFDECLNTGFVHHRNFFSNDIEELKEMVENELTYMVSIFKNIQTV